MLTSHNVKFFQQVDVVVQFYPWFKFYFPLFLGMVIYVMCDNELKTKKIKFEPRIKIEPQHR